MKNLKDNIWIEGFDMHEVGHFMVTKDRNFIGDIAKEIIYSGKTSDIPEEIANGGVLKMMRVDAEDLVQAMYRRYPAGNMEVQSLTHQYSCVSAKESIQSACNQEYCIIFKK